jgi:hypothetical protein
VSRLPPDTPIWTDGQPGWLPVSSVALCPRCGIERPMVKKKWRPIGAKEWISTVLFFPLCFPFILIGLLLPVRRCTQCQTIVR